MLAGKELASCLKFRANIFNTSKCQDCFRARDSHPALDEELTQAKPLYGGWLCLAPEGTDFGNSLQRSRKWQRRFFLLYEHGELRYALDAVPSTLPQGVVCMSEVVEVAEAESRTGQRNSLCISTPQRHFFVRGETREDIGGWQEVLGPYVLVNKQTLKKRNAGKSLQQEPSPPKATSGHDATDEPGATDAAFPQCRPGDHSSCPTFMQQMHHRSRTRGGLPRSASACSLSRDDVCEGRTLEGAARAGPPGGPACRLSVGDGVQAVATGNGDVKGPGQTQQRCPPQGEAAPVTKELSARFGSVLPPERRAKSLDRRTSEATMTVRGVRGQGARGRGHSRCDLEESIALERLTSSEDDCEFASAVMTSGASWSFPLCDCDVVSRQWRKHWFVLTDGSLKFYKDSMAEEALDEDGEIDLTACHNVAPLDTQRNYGFQIHTSDGVFTLSAMTAGIRRNWVQSLSSSVRPATSRRLASGSHAALRTRRPEFNSHTRSAAPTGAETEVSGPPTCPSAEARRAPGAGAGEGAGEAVAAESEPRPGGGEDGAVGEEGKVRRRAEVPRDAPRGRGARSGDAEGRPGDPEGREAEAAAGAELARLVQELRRRLGEARTELRGRPSPHEAECERGLLLMEECHRGALRELQEAQRRTVAALGEEKERLLAEETAATVAAIEAMKTAYREELEKLRQSRGGASRSVTEERAQHEQDLASLQREIEALSEQYSHKSLQAAHLLQALEAERAALQQSRRNNRELNARNQVTRGTGDGRCSGEETRGGGVALRVKESEIEFLKQELRSLREELHTAQRDKKLAAHRYKDMYREMSLARAHAQRDSRLLQEKLRRLTQQQQQQQQLASPGVDRRGHAQPPHDVLKSRSNPEGLRAGLASVGQRLKVLAFVLCVRACVCLCVFVHETIFFYQAESEGFPLGDKAQKTPVDDVTWVLPCSSRHPRGRRGLPACPAARGQILPQCSAVPGIAAAASERIAERDDGEDDEEETKRGDGEDEKRDAHSLHFPPGGAEGSRSSPRGAPSSSCSA
ncbi:unnamed protein product [Lampetra fluviatilis]